MKITQRCVRSGGLSAREAAATRVLSAARGRFSVFLAAPRVVVPCVCKCSRKREKALINERARGIRVCSVQSPFRAAAIKFQRQLASAVVRTRRAFNECIGERGKVGGDDKNVLWFCLTAF